MALKRVFAGFYTRYDGKPIFVVRLLKDIDTGESIVVCKDAMGVRLETGRQAVIINDIVEAFNSLASEKLPEAKLKEFVGHTPLQVIAGILLGVANTFIMYYCVL